MRTAALAEAREGPGAADPHVAAAKNNLAELYRLQRRYEEAEAPPRRRRGVGAPLRRAASASGLRRTTRRVSPRARRRQRRVRRVRGREGRNARRWAAPPGLRRDPVPRGEASARARRRARRRPRARRSERAGQGESSPALRRRERLAQVQGDVLGNHAAAEATRRKVARAREEAVRRCDEGSGEHPARTHHPRGSASGQRPRRSPLPSALAAALEAHASSLSALVMDEAPTTRGAVKARARRVECLGGGRGWVR